MLQAEIGNKPQMFQTEEPDTSTLLSEGCTFASQKDKYNFKGSKFVNHSAKKWLGNFFDAGFAT
jgi:hypothetical protein